MAKTIPLLTFVCCLMLTCARAQNADINILKDINLHRNRSLDKEMALLTNSVYPIAAAAPLCELAIGYARHDSTLMAKGYTTIAGIGINFVVAFGLKYTVNRQRPYDKYSFLEPYRHNTDPSFPSGHTSFAFNTATSLSLTFPRWYVIIPAYTWASAVAYSRMDLGMHYPTDVLAGALIGAGSSLLAFEGNKWLRKHHHKTP